MAYFYPRLVRGGIIVCDDYGSKVWDGTKEAVDAWLDKQDSIRFIQLSTGQLLILKD